MDAILGPRAAGPDRSAAQPEEIPLARFVKTQAVALTRFAFLLCGDRELAEDLVQDTFVSLHRRFGETLRIEAPVPYARRAIVNANLSRLRRRRPHETLFADVPDTSTYADADRTEQAAMWRLLGDLPARQRAVLVLRYYLDQPDAEIAQLLRCREGTVRSLAARAFATMRAHPDFATKETRS